MEPLMLNDDYVRYIIQFMGHYRTSPTADAISQDMEENIVLRSLYNNDYIHNAPHLHITAITSKWELLSAHDFLNQVTD